MNLLFSSGRIGQLKLKNRIVRSATAERMADNQDGHPLPRLEELWVNLARGGTGLIISGHMYIHSSGKCHPEMTGIDRDELIPHLAKLTAAVHQAGGKVAAQINHGGMQCSPECVTETLAPSDISADFLAQPARSLTVSEIEMLIEAYAQAARRAAEAGFDAVQLHGAHGYLISQFISPYVNRRQDGWGGDLHARTRFLREVVRAVRREVGADYPLLIKFGMEDNVPGGLSAAEGAQVVAQMAQMGLDGVEISGGIRANASRKGIRSEDREAYFAPWAQLVRPLTHLPIILVGGIRSRTVMEKVLASGIADFIAMSRPLINDPDFPNKMLAGLTERSACLSSNNCWPTHMGEGIACKCPSIVKEH